MRRTGSVVLGLLAVLIIACPIGANSAGPGFGIVPVTGSGPYTTWHVYVSGSCTADLRVFRAADRMPPKVVYSETLGLPGHPAFVNLPSSKVGNSWVQWHIRHTDIGGNFELRPTSKSVVWPRQ